MNNKSVPALNLKQWKRFVRQIKVAPSGCWEWNGSRTEKGYGQFGIGREVYFVHRIAYRMAKNSDPGDLLGCHTCDNPRCCRPDHIFLGTNSDNMRDAISKGRKVGRVKKPRTPKVLRRLPKLTEESARAIKHSNESHSAIAQRYSVSRVMVTLIKQGKRWKHV